MANIREVYLRIIKDAIRHGLYQCESINRLEQKSEDELIKIMNEIKNKKD